MRYVDELRAPDALRRAADRLAREATRAWTIMEVCGGQTHAIARYGIDDLLPPGLTLVHGPGCPVCVTPLEVLEAARAVALRAGVTLSTFGDMLRVPGASGDLLDARAHGADVRVIASPLDAVRLARREPDRMHVFFAVGFETTAPTTAMALELAERLALDNFAVLASHVRVPPAMEAILGAEGCAIDGFLAAGHVCTIEGIADYVTLASRFEVPIVVTGFEPADILQGLAMCVRQLEAGRCEVDNQYARAVRATGNAHARSIVDRWFEVVDRPWRGLGVVPRGALAMREEHARFDAARRLAIQVGAIEEPARCRAALVLQGKITPRECPELGVGCTPDRPLGAPMVSSEGACAAHYRYRRSVS